MVRRVYVPLDEIERRALGQLASRERRDPRAQAALLIRRELERLGLIERPTLTQPEVARESAG